MSFSISGVGSSGVLPDLVKRLRDLATRLNAIPTTQDAVSSIKDAIQSLEKIINDQDSAGGQRLKEALVAMIMNVSALNPNWRQQIGDKACREMGINGIDKVSGSDNIRESVHHMLHPSLSPTSTPTQLPTSPLPIGEQPPLGSPSANLTTGVATPPSETAPSTAPKSQPHTTLLRFGQAQQLIRHLARLNVSIPNSFLGDIGTFNLEKLDQLTKILKDIERAKHDTLGARQLDILERICDQLSDGIEDLAELQQIIKMMGKLSQISSSLLDLLQDMTRNWFASESQNMSPKEISEQIEQINQLATACIGIPLLPLTTDETPPTSDAIPPLQPIHPSTLQGLIPSSDANTPPAIPELGLQQAGLCIEKMVELLTDHTLQKVDDALDRIQRLLGG